MSSCCSAPAATTTPTRRASSTPRSWSRATRSRSAAPPSGSIEDIALTGDGQAQITFSLDHQYGPLRHGTKAIIRQASLSGVANRYIDLQPGPGTNSALAPGEVLGTDHTTTAVDLDQVFNVFGPRQRKALSQLIRGSRNTYAGNSKAANAGWLYLNPALASSARLFEALDSDPTQLRHFIDANGRLVTDVAARQQDLAGLVNNLANTTRAIGSQRAALQHAIVALPRSCARPTRPS